ncbi:MAG: caspase family protein [Cytophagaceae bacterium]|nr:caspase family protein [Cytophagaceae bacterium]
MKNLKAILLSIFSICCTLLTFSQDIKPTKTLEESGHVVIAMAFSPDNKILATAGLDNNVILWDMISGTKMNTLKGHSNWVVSLCFSPSGNYIASGSKDNTGKIWDVRSGSEIVSLKGHTGSVSSITYSPDGKSLATGSKDNSVKVWDAVSGIAIRSLGGHTKEVSSVSFSPDGFKLASSGADLHLKIWDVQSGNIDRTLEAHTDYVRNVSFSPDGKYIATAGDDKMVKLWDAASGSLVKTIKGHSKWVQSLHFSPDGKYLASSGHDGAATVWDVATGTEAFAAKKQAAIVYDVEFSNDGKMLATCDNTKIKIWDISKLNIQPKEAPTVAKNNTEIKSTSNDLNFDPAAKGKNYLLIVGISTYSHWPQLGNAVKDAKDVKRILTTKYTFAAENVVEVYDEQATIEGIYAAFNKLKAKVTPNDNLLIYFSGHGFYNAGLDEGYWIPVDAHKGKETEYLPNSTLLKYLKALDSKHTFLVADACFSGALFSDGHRGYVENVEAMKSRWGLTSGRLEYVSDGNVGKNSPFATYFIKYLDTNTKKRFTVSELIQYVKVSVANNSDQTPIGNPLRNVGDEGGEFVFYLK